MKNKYITSLLALFLGTFGIHQFYLDNIKKGIFYIIFSWSLIPTLISVIESLYFLSINKNEFDRKYNLSKKLDGLKTDSEINTNFQKLTEQKEPIKEHLERKTDFQKFTEKEKPSGEHHQVNIDFKTPESLLQNITKLSDFEKIKNWKKSANQQILTLSKKNEYISFMRADFHSKINQIRKNNSFLKATKLELEFNQKSKNFIENEEKIINHSNLLIENLKTWINKIPNNKKHLTEIKFKLTKDKKILDIEKRELNVRRKEVWTEYRKRYADVEIISKKNRHLNRGLNMKVREHSLDPIDSRINEINRKQIEIDKLLFWLNNITMPNTM